MDGRPCTLGCATEPGLQADSSAACLLTWGFSFTAVMWDDSFGPVVAMYVVHTCAVLNGSASAWPQGRGTWPTGSASPGPS